MKKDFEGVILAFKLAAYFYVHLNTSYLTENNHFTREYQESGKVSPNLPRLDKVIPISPSGQGYHVSLSFIRGVYLDLTRFSQVFGISLVVRSSQASCCRPMLQVDELPDHSAINSGDCARGTRLRKAVTAAGWCATNVHTSFVALDVVLDVLFSRNSATSFSSLRLPYKERTAS